MRGGGRWNAPGLFPVIYASTLPETALAESLARQRYFKLPETEAMPLLVVGLDVDLSKALDLTTASRRRALKVSLAALLQVDWRAEQESGREALTQAIGRAAYDAGYEGMLVPSYAAREANGTNVLVFPERIEAGQIAVVNSAELKRWRNA